jgi:hypothetical protein
MTRTKRLALAFYVGAVAAGAAMGITVDRWILRERLVNQWEDQKAARARFGHELRLDATQRAALDTILDARNRVYDDLMDPIRPQLDSVGSDARQQIRQLLTPEQLAIYDKMQAEREAARRQEKKQ